jgi:hypothetical protein
MIWKQETIKFYWQSLFFEIIFRGMNLADIITANVYLEIVRRITSPAYKPNKSVILSFKTDSEIPQSISWLSHL